MQLHLKVLSVYAIYPTSYKYMSNSSLHFKLLLIIKDEIFYLRTVFYPYRFIGAFIHIAAVSNRLTRIYRSTWGVLI